MVMHTATSAKITGYRPKAWCHMVATHNFHKNHGQVLLQTITQLKLQSGDLLRRFCRDGSRDNFTATMFWEYLPSTLVESYNS